MANDPLSDVVSNQYERWVYPLPIMDLPGWLTSNWQWFDPSHAYRMLWPSRDYWPGMDVLVAGCGTNQAAVLAYTNPDARVVAVDISQSSLNHHRYLKDKYGLNNLELHRLPIEDIFNFNRDFDLIVSTGVLHHLDDPQKGLDALVKRLRPDGVIALMLYARYGRIGVEIMQSVFRDMDLKQGDTSVAMVRDALSALAQDHPLRSYLQFASDLQYDAGMVDTFLHGRDRSYTILDCMAFAENSGMVFQDLFLKSPYYPPVSANSGFFSNIQAMPERRQWSIMERINTRNACHFFTLCKPERDPKTYRIDFRSNDAQNYAPSFRYRCGINGDRLYRPDWGFALDQSQLALIRNIDGQTSIRKIIEKAKSDNSVLPLGSDGGLAFGMAFFQSLWQRDFIAINI